MSQNQARRTGLIARKVGMTQVFDKDGRALAVTLLKADENFVLANKTKQKDGYTSIVMGFGEAKAHRTSKPLKGICTKAAVKPVQVIKEFRVSENALLQPGAKLSIGHFVEGQFVDIQGVNIGKGFAGGMKRHNFRGLEATHGVSISHRSIGSTGQRQDPGKTFRGKKMPGHMGVETVTIQNIQITLIDMELGIIAINGSVPGRRGTYLTISDAVKVSLPSGAKFPAALVEGDATKVTTKSGDKSETLESQEVKEQDTTDAMDSSGAEGANANQ
jgi:large subunit ribosomal protein L3